MVYIEDILNDIDANASVAMLTKVRNKFCFVVQPKNRWGQSATGEDVVFFGGIGGKLEHNENLEEALHRESIEEVGCDFSIIQNKETNIPIITKENIEYKSIIGSCDNPTPIFIFQNIRSEVGRKNKTNIFVYHTELKNIEAMTPLDNPAIILVPEPVLYEMINGMSLKDALAKGVEIISTIELPEDGVLMPTPTPFALIRLHEKNIDLQL